MHVKSLDTGKAVGQRRTYSSPNSNPKAFILLPGDYEVQVKEIRGERRSVKVSVAAGDGAHQTFGGTVDLPDGGWVAVRVTGLATTAWPAMDSYAFAHTSPVWIGEVGSVDRDAELRSIDVLEQALAGARLDLELSYAGSPIPNLTARFDSAQAELVRRRNCGVVSRCRGRGGGAGCRR